MTPFDPATFIALYSSKTAEGGAAWILVQPNPHPVPSATYHGKEAAVRLWRMARNMERGAQGAPPLDVCAEPQGVVGVEHLTVEQTALNNTNVYRVVGLDIPQRLCGVFRGGRAVQHHIDMLTFFCARHVLGPARGDA